MTSPLNDYLPEIMQQAIHAYHQKDWLNAKRYAKQAIKINPNQETPWLILAATTNAEQALEYLKQGQILLPHSLRIQQALRITEEKITHSQSLPLNKSQGKREIIETRKSNKTSLVWLFIFICSIAVLLFALFNPWYPVSGKVQAIFQTPVISSSLENAIYIKPTLTASPTATFTTTPTATLTPTPTVTPSPSPTATSTFTATVTASPTATKQPTPTPALYDQNGRWIDVDLTNQTLYAYEGETVVQSFLISSGMVNTPTLTGQYNIYVKYEYADMSGPGYYIPDVPYTQYYSNSYGIHAATWHNNFGTPMSHGCINMRLEDAKWLFNWTSIGTLVNIHY